MVSLEIDEGAMNKFIHLQVKALPPPAHFVSPASPQGGGCLWRNLARIPASSLWGGTRLAR